MATLAELGKKHPITTEGVEFPVDDEQATMGRGDIVEAWIEADRDLSPLLAGPAIEQLLKMKEQYPEFVLHYIKIETRRVTIQFSAAPGSGGISGGVSGANGQAIAGTIAIPLVWSIALALGFVVALLVGLMSAYFQLTRGWIFVKPLPLGNALVHAKNTLTKAGIPDVEISVDGEYRGTTGSGGSYLVEDLLEGPHRFIGAELENFHPPLSKIANVIKDEQILVDIGYTPLSEPPPTDGYLVVATYPVTGDIWVGGTPYYGPDPILLPIGDYIITFGDVEGYITPKVQTVTVDGNLTTVCTAKYLLPEVPEGPWYEKYLKYALIGGGAILGAALIVPEVIRAISRRGEKK